MIIHKTSTVLEYLRANRFCLVQDFCNFHRLFSFLLFGHLALRIRYTDTWLNLREGLYLVSSGLVRHVRHISYPLLIQFLWLLRDRALYCTYGCFALIECTKLSILFAPGIKCLILFFFALIAAIWSRYGDGGCSTVETRGEFTVSLVSGWRPTSCTYLRRTHWCCAWIPVEKNTGEW